jgi:general stress protein CsbA
MFLKMKLPELIFFCLTIVFLVIGIDQTLSHGFLASYFIFTFAVFSFLGYGYMKRKREEKSSK